MRRFLSLLLGVILLAVLLLAIEALPLEKRIYCPEERVILKWHTRAYRPMERRTDHFVKDERPPACRKITGLERIGRDGFRIIPGVEQGRREIWLFGASVIYGIGLADEDVMSRCLERALPDTRVRNFGIVGTTSEAGIRILAEHLRRAKAPPDFIIWSFGINDSSMGYGLDRDRSKWWIYKSRMLLSRFTLYHLIRRFLESAQLDGEVWKLPCRVPLEEYLENHQRALDLSRSHGAEFLIAMEPYWEHDFWDSTQGRPFYREMLRLRSTSHGIDWHKTVERLRAMGRPDLIFSYYNTPLLEYWTALRAWAPRHGVPLLSMNQGILQSSKRLGIAQDDLFPEVHDPSTGHRTRDCMHPNAWGAEFAVQGLIREIRSRPEPRPGRWSPR